MYVPKNNKKEPKDTDTANKFNLNYQKVKITQAVIYSPHLPGSTNFPAGLMC